MKILDVGCGDTPVGDVNCDRFIYDIENHRGGKEGGRYSLDSKKIPNLVICDAQYLPFKNDVFELVVSRQVIEHIKKPLVMLDEMVRTSNGLIVIETTHRRGERRLKNRDWKHDTHINKFDFTYFAKAADKLNCTLIKSTTLNSLPLIGLIGFNIISVPYGIRLIMQKNNCKNTIFNVNKAGYLAEIEKSILS